MECETPLSSAQPPTVSRLCPDSITLRRAFCRTITLCPLDKNANALGRRRSWSCADNTKNPEADELACAGNEWPPLLKKMIAEHSTTGLPPTSIPLGATTTGEQV